MDVLTKDEILWAGFLAKEPTRKERQRPYLWQGFLFYLILFRRFPLRCLAEVAGCAMIFATLFFMLYLSEIAAWIEGVLK